jgi:hypothetical protein
MWKSFRELIFWCRNTGLEEVLSGNGTPEGAVTADIGTLYLRKDGGANTTLYVKESGDGTDSGWVAK